MSEKSVNNYYFKSEEVGSAKDRYRPPKIGNKSLLNSYDYKKPSIYPNPITFNRNGIPIAFREVPESLLRLCVRIVDKFPLPKVYTWSIEHICAWLRNYGYPQYQNTFRVNLVNGRTLLLLDASALSAMNIKNFDHIRHIAYGIRCLFYYEMTRFSRSISYAPEFHLELYKLLRSKNGPKYDTSIASALWLRMQVIRPILGLKDHWDILESWLRFENENQKVIVGGAPRTNLYACQIPRETKKKTVELLTHCKCIPPCECYWTERELRQPWSLSSLTDLHYDKPTEHFEVLSVLNHVSGKRYSHLKI